MRSAILCSLAVLLTLPAGAAVADWPEGESREIAEAVCTSCHSLGTIERSMGYDQEGWGELIATMVNLSAAPEIRDGITAYLAAHFPPNDARAATFVPGDVTVSFSEWVVPTPGQRSRDPVEAPDGAIWWAGQWANLIGRIDPQTGEMLEYRLPDNAMPHSVNVDAAGHVWYTGNKNGTIGRLGKSGPPTDQTLYGNCTSLDCSGVVTTDQVCDGEETHVAYLYMPAVLQDIAVVLVGGTPAGRSGQAPFLSLDG